ncbi:MAG: ABC transporter ATP-binding protein [Deltaproteobacteria bacterium]|nr:ABC transporter ATP-binding protein [Deltaproteobacteria bacterium]MDH3802373.1 ABC transporter ATP-binding protein [Deltaproteobacteria bacterium]MDH3927388.1 ABC transporter ATP-binding protein [Deltaproteobacteria bacterium]MDH3950692.1 ABC transporter ATP-binding protein [Deltaproteobacteria bacterium]MDH3963682.1 ABC transporter ATP-binding protein [Deltaproteobacteria bacterium]
MLRIRNLQTYYGRIRVLDNVSLSVKPGEVVTLIGANGAGKSTILNCISRLIPCREGEIFFQGQRINGQSPEAVVRLGICQVPEGRQIFQPLTVLENLELGAYLRYGKRNRGSIQQDMDMVFSLFPVLAERLQQISGTLSGGEQQMLAIGRALMSRPKLLLLDEPSMGLAPRVVADIFHTVVKLRQEGLTILIVEQNARAVLRIADRGYVMETGKIILQGTASELLEDHDVKRAYLGRDYREFTEGRA